MIISLRSFVVREKLKNQRGEMKPPSSFVSERPRLKFVLFTAVMHLDNFDSK